MLLGLRVKHWRGGRTNILWHTFDTSWDSVMAFKEKNWSGNRSSLKKKIAAAVPFFVGDDESEEDQKGTVNKKQLQWELRALTHAETLVLNRIPTHTHVDGESHKFMTAKTTTTTESWGRENHIFKEKVAVLLTTEGGTKPEWRFWKLQGCVLSSAYGRGLTCSWVGLGWILSYLATECRVVPQRRLTFPLHQGGQLLRNGAEVGRIEEAQDGARFRHSHQDVELIREGLSQSRNHRAKACNQSVEAGLTTRAGAQRGQKVQHRLHSQTLQGENVYL